MKTFLSILFLSVFLSFSASALTLKEAKQSGIVGEQMDGYLGIVRAHADAKRLILAVNTKRLNVYQKLAKNNKLPVASVAKLAGEKAIAKTAKGNYIRSAQGRWIKK
jgi:uncharacterized protein